MISENKPKSKRSLDNLLDELIDNPSDIDVSLIGDVRADSVRSSTISKGQADFLQLNDFIDKNNRLPSSSSDSHDEQKMARRMNAYAHNPVEFQELRSLDKHGLIDKSRYQKPTARPTPLYEDLEVDTANGVADFEIDNEDSGAEDMAFLDPEIQRLIDNSDNSTISSIVDANIVDANVENNHIEASVIPNKEPVMAEVPTARTLTTIEDQEVAVSDVDNIEYKIVTIPVNSDIDAMLLIEVDKTELSALFEKQGLSSSTPKRLASLKKPIVIGFQEKELIVGNESIETNENNGPVLDLTEASNTSPIDSNTNSIDADPVKLAGLNNPSNEGSAVLKEKDEADSTKDDHQDNLDKTVDSSQSSHVSEPEIKEGDGEDGDVYLCVGFSEEHEVDDPKNNSGSVSAVSLEDEPVSNEKSSQDSEQPTKSKPVSPRGSSNNRVTVDDNFELIGQVTETKPVEVDTSEKEANEFSSIDDILDADDGFLESLCEAEEMYFDVDNKYTETDDRAMPDEVGKQTPCNNFYMYEARFKELHAKLKSNELKTVAYTVTNIKKGDAFILNGMVGFIESIGEHRETTSGNYDPRLRLVFDNGTESNILLRSLSRALYMDKTSRLIVRSSDDFTDFEAHDSVSKVKTGQIYIVKSLSANPRLRQVRNLHKIGFTKHTVEERIKNAKNDITFLESAVEVVEKIDCYDLDPRGLEGCIHDFLHYQRVNITLTSRYGKSYKPKEWFSIHIEDAKKIVACIVDGSIVNYRMDNTTNRMVERKL